MRFLPSSGCVITNIWMHHVYGCSQNTQRKSQRGTKHSEHIQVAPSRKKQMYGHLPPISKTIKVSRRRQAGNCPKN